MFIDYCDTMDESIGRPCVAVSTYPHKVFPRTVPPDSTTNLTSSMGLPAVVVPGGQTKENSPIGIRYGRRSTANENAQVSTQL